MRWFLLGGVAAAVGLAGLFLLRRPSSVASSGSPSARSSPTRVITRTLTKTLTKTSVPGPQAPGVKAPPPSPPPSQAAATKALGDLALGTAAPQLGLASAQVLRASADALRTGTLNVITPQRTLDATRSTTSAFVDAVLSPGTSTAADALDSAAGSVGSVAPQVLTAGVKLIGLRGKTEVQQRAIFGQTTLVAFQGALSAIPLVGGALSAAAGLLAGTGTGKKVVRETGRVEEQGYNFQKDLFSGRVSDAFSGGGRSHKERVRALLDLQRKAGQGADKGDPVLLAKQDKAARDLAGRALDAALRGDFTVPGAESFRSEVNRRAAVELAKDQALHPERWVPTTAAQLATMAGIKASIANAPQEAAAAAADRNRFLAEQAKNPLNAWRNPYAQVTFGG